MASWRPDSPIELPGGRLVCGKHGLVICGKCCVDYSFMEDVEDEDEDEEVEAIKETTPESDPSLDGFLGDKTPRGTGRAMATEFKPPSPSDTPQVLFSGRYPAGGFSDPGSRMGGFMRQPNRFFRSGNPRQALMYTDGACLDNGQANPRAGWAFVLGPHQQNSTGPYVVSGRLEKQGPYDDEAAQTSNRAELRAVIGALGFRHWPGEGFKSLVIATDSEYVTEGATSRIANWIRRGWRTSGGQPVKNKDLWEHLLGRIEAFADEGLQVMFWRISRDWNLVADAEAKKAAEKTEVSDRFSMVHGVMC